MVEKASATERPTAFRSEAGLELNESALRLVVAMAQSHGEDVQAILREVRKCTPSGRLILKLLQVKVPETRNGRQVDPSRAKAIHHVVTELSQVVGSRAAAIKLAPAELARRGIVGAGASKRQMTEKAVRENLRKTAHIWFDETAVPEQVEDE